MEKLKLADANDLLAKRRRERLHKVVYIKEGKTEILYESKNNGGAFMKAYYLAKKMFGKNYNVVHDSNLPAGGYFLNSETGDVIRVEKD